VIDASHPQWEEQRHVVNSVLDELGVQGKTTLHVFNKIDRVPAETLLALEERIMNLLPNSVFVSAQAEDGLEPLRRSLLTNTRSLRPLSEIRLGAGEGRLLAEIHRLGEVVDQRTDGADLILRARVDDALAGRLRRAGARVDNAASNGAATRDAARTTASSGDHLADLP
jgi:GTP-binding protein HflX